MNIDENEAKCMGFGTEMGRSGPQDAYAHLDDHDAHDHKGAADLRDDPDGG